jgi:hypothetical protein
MAKLAASLDRCGASLPNAECGRGYQSITPALDALNELVLIRILLRGTNSLLTWPVSSATVQRDPAGNRKLDKGRTEFERIDGAVPLTIAAKRFSEGDNVKRMRAACAFCSYSCGGITLIFASSFKMSSDVSEMLLFISSRFRKKSANASPFIVL